MYRAIIFTCVFLFYASGLEAQLLLNTGSGLPGLGKSTAVWADFNNDGLLDVAITGINGAGAKEAGLYLNNDDGTFTNSGVGLIPVSDGSLAVGDINNDGYVDLLLAGTDSDNNKVARLYKNSSGVFTPLALTLPGVSFGTVHLSDMNNDGLTDIVLNGMNGLNTRVTQVYQNKGTDNFDLLTTPFIGTSHGSVVIGDFNNDSYQDIVVTGLNNSNQRTTRFYHNKGNGLFTEIATVLPAVRSGGLTTTDLNSDGYIDLLVMGNTASSTNLSQLFLNNTGNGFLASYNFPPLIDGGSAFGDYDNDGLPDVVMFGYDGAYQTFLYKNNGDETFSAVAAALPGNVSGGVHWIDYNHDNKLDLHMHGYSVSIPFSNLFENQQSVGNTLPNAPTNLSYTAYADSVVLMWDKPVDNETSSASLSYEVYIGTSPGTINIQAPLANISTTTRKVAHVGRYTRNIAVIQGLPEGRYYWSAQAIDASLDASSFAVEHSFVSCSRVKIAGVNEACYKNDFQLHVGTTGDDVRWYTTHDPLHALGSGITLQTSLEEKQKVYAVVTKPLGCTVSDTTTVDILPLPLVKVGDDVIVCTGDRLRLEAQTAIPNIRWYTQADPVTTLSTSAILHYQVKAPHIFIARIQDSKGCINSDSIEITLHPLRTTNLGPDREICMRDELTLSTGSSTDVVNWYGEKAGVLATNTFDLHHKVFQDDTIWAHLHDENGCNVYDTLTVTMLPLPHADAGTDQMICEGNPIAIGGAYPDNTLLSFSWSPSSFLSSSIIANPLASPSTDTKYVLTVTAENNCYTKDSLMVYLNRPSTINAGKDTTICVGDQFFLGGKPTASGSTLPYTFTWSPDQGLSSVSHSNPLAFPKTTTTYRLQTKAGTCILETHYVTVTVNPLPVVKANDDAVVGVEEPITLSVGGAVSYRWFPEELFPDNTLAQPIISPNRTTRYWVEGTDGNGCVSRDTVSVTVRSELFVPSLFTPNSDGQNDVFRAHGFGIKEITLKVFDRWGRLLFESSSLEHGWDGRNNGGEIEQGSFVWTVEGSFHDGTPVRYNGQQRGIVKLIR